MNKTKKKSATAGEAKCEGPGRDAGGLIPTREGLVVCKLNPFSPSGSASTTGPRMSTERKNRQGSEHTSGGSARYDLALTLISAIHS